MIEREVAWRVFADEFNRSDYFFHEGNERSPNYLVTPTGARINRMYFVGVLTEIDNLGTQEDMIRARVSDPTGTFTVYAGQYQPEAAVFLAELDIPSFVAIIGKARTYEPEDGTVYTSVRPEELNSSDTHIRDRWIIDTARLTFERIKLVRYALTSRLEGDALTELLMHSGAGTQLADGIARAVDHYCDLDQYLDTITDVIINALGTLVPDRYQPSYKSDITSDRDIEETKYDEMIYELMGRLDKGDGVPLTELMEKSKPSGLTEEQVCEAVNILMSEGRCYEPRIDILRKL